MKNLFKNIAVVFIMIFTLNSVNAQNKKLEIKAEKVEGGVKVVTVEDGKKSEVIYSIKDAEKYFKEIGESIDFDIDEISENNYKVSYAIDGNKKETIEIDFENLLENMSLNLTDLTQDIEDLIKQVSSQIEYEEHIDKDGNKTIKISSSSENEK